MLGRYYSPRDMRFMQSINNELLDNIVQSFIKIYRISPEATNTNIYNESTGETGKVYFPGVLISGLIVHPDSTTKHEGPGNDRAKTGMKFCLNENSCKKSEFYPVSGDIVEWDRVFYEVGNVIQNEYLGGQWDKSWSIILEAHMTKTSRLNIIERAQDVK